MAYATESELNTYLGVTESPTDATRLLERASELIDYVTLNKINTSVTAQNTAAKDATMAQVEYWLTSGEDSDINGSVKGYSIGSFSIDYGEEKMSTLAPRARRHLMLAGLLYRGVKRS